MLLAHIMGMPFEELLVPSAGAVTAGALLSLASVIASIRGRRRPGRRKEQ